MLAFCVFLHLDWSGVAVPALYFPFNSKEGISLVNGAVLTPNGKVFPLNDS